MVNRIILQGRLTRDPELKRTSSDIARVEFTVAWSKKYKENETKCFLRCVAWRQTAEFVSKYFRKGKEIIVEGYMVTDEWTDKDSGEKKSRTLCTLDEANLCGPKDGWDARSESGTREEPEVDEGFMNVPEGVDEDLPFA